MRAIFLSYENKIMSGKYIFVVKDKIIDRGFDELKRDFNFAFKRLELLK
ncbi:ribonuclease P [Arcobacter sp. 31_11_sub10_T18]|nr:ribonuclease P [Arcobacter sp. 31_11_sub10_T18]